MQGKSSNPPVEPLKSGYESVQCSRVAPFYLTDEISKPAHLRVYHDNDACLPGRDIPIWQRRLGTGGYRLCDDCRMLDTQGPTSISSGRDFPGHVLARYYKFRDPTRVLPFLFANPDLESLLVDCHIRVAEYFTTAAALELEVLTDPDGHGETLFILIRTDLPVVEARQRLRRLDEDWWLVASGEGLGRLSIDVEYT